MVKTFRPFTLKTIDKTAREFLNWNKGKRIFSFYGEMGIGKTTFIKSLCKQLKCKETITSPTFSIVNEYIINAEKSVYHFDFYRIKNAEELYDIGFEDYIYSPHLVFIEWPDKAEEVIPDEAVKVSMNSDSHKNRIISIE